VSAGVSAYRVGPKLVICAMSVTTTGLLVDDGPRYSPPADDPLAVGRAVLRALGDVRTRAPHPKPAESLMQPTLDAAGVSLRRFRKEALYVGMELAGDRLVFTPTRNLGAKGGFEWCPAEQLLAAADDPEAVGRTLLEAFTRAR
jgi:hypothetical protein